MTGYPTENQTAWAGYDDWRTRADDYPDLDDGDEFPDCETEADRKLVAEFMAAARDRHAAKLTALRND